MSIEINIKSGNPEKQRTACLVLGVFENKRLSNTARAVDTASKKYLSNILRKGDMKGKPGNSLVLHNVPGIVADRVLLIGCGRERDLNESTYRRINSATINTLKNTGAADAVSYLPDLALKGRNTYWKVKQAAEVSFASMYEFNEFKGSKRKQTKSFKKLTLTVPTRKELPEGETAIKHGLAVAHGVETTRKLGDRPANACTPRYLADQARQLARKHKSLKVTVLDETEMKKLGMGSLLSVAQGSAEPPRLICFEYSGGKKAEKPVALVGKGVTFDTGGISIKPAPAMDEMKYDMCGAATVFGVITAAVEMGLPMNLVGIIPATENMPSGTATKPGDIFTSMSGQTIEVLNTDAEGRLILCDALTYAEQFEPKAVVDIATLTGACVIALGKHATGLLSNHNPLARDLLSAGETSGDRAWQLPLWEEYDKQLSSPFADMANIGGREAGTITAACFLSRFTKKMHWAHLDIAGTAWNTGKNKGATGRPVPLLTQYLLDLCKLSPS